MTFNLNPLKEQLINLKKDIENPNGRFTQIIKESVQSTASYLADSVMSLGTFKNRNGTIYNAIRNSWRVDRASNLCYLTDTDLMDKQIGPFKRSSNQHTKREYTYNIPELNFDGKVSSYWYFVLMGWGKEGNFRGDEYDWIATVRDSSGKIFRTSPYNREIGKSLEQINMQRHPGHAGKNWYKVLFNNYTEFYMQDFNRRGTVYISTFFN